MDGQLQSLIDALDVASYERMVRAALKSLATACGFGRFAYLQTAGGEIKTLNSYMPECEETYLKNRYSRIDSVVASAKRRMEMFAWSADDWTIRDMTKEEELFRSADFFNAILKELGYLPNRLFPQQSPFELKRGSVIHEFHKSPYAI